MVVSFAVRAFLKYVEWRVHRLALFQSPTLHVAVAVIRAGHLADYTYLGSELRDTIMLHETDGAIYNLQTWCSTC